MLLICRFGHTHWYTRSCPVYKRQRIPAAADGSQRAPVHINIGNAGASFSWDVMDPALLTQDIYAAFAMQHGYMRVNATRTSLQIQVCPEFLCCTYVLHLHLGATIATHPGCMLVNATRTSLQNHVCPHLLHVCCTCISVQPLPCSLNLPSPSVSSSFAHVTF